MQEVGISIRRIEKCPLLSLEGPDVLHCVYLCFLSGVPSLAEQCKAVIMSTLVELDSVQEAEQLSERLPDHVPPRVKHYLTSRFGLFTLTRPPPE